MTVTCAAPYRQNSLAKGDEQMGIERTLRASPKARMRGNRLSDKPHLPVRGQLLAVG